MHYIAHYLHTFFQGGEKIIQFPCLVVNNQRGEDILGGTIYPSDVWMISKQRYNPKIPPICSTSDGILQPTFSIDDIKTEWIISNDGKEYIWYYNGKFKKWVNLNSSIQNTCYTRHNICTLYTLKSKI